MVLLLVNNHEVPIHPVLLIEGEFPSVEEVRATIFDRTGISNQLQLIYLHEQTLLRDNTTMESYDVEDWDVVIVDVYSKLLPSLIDVRVPYNYGIYRFEIGSSSTVRKAKKMLDRLGVCVPPHRQRLRYWGNLMEDNDLLSDYVTSTDNEFTLEEIPPNYNLMITVIVNVWTPEGIQERDYDVELNDTLYTLLGMVQMAGHADKLGECHFVYSGRRLKMTKSIEYHMDFNGLAPDEELDLMYG